MKKVNQLALQFVYLFDEDGRQCYQIIAPNGQCLAFETSFPVAMDALSAIMKKLENSVKTDS